MAIRGAKDLIRILEETSGAFGLEIIGSMYLNKKREGPKEWGERVCLLDTRVYRIEAHQFLGGNSGQTPHIRVSVHKEDSPLFLDEREKGIISSRLSEKGVQIVSGYRKFTFRVPSSEESLRKALFSFYEVMKNYEKIRQDYYASLES